MTPLLLDIGSGELLALVALAAVLLGPERVPGLAKKAGRIIRFLRGVANDATDQIKTELGADLGDLNVADLKPANLVRQILSEKDETELVVMRAEIEDMRTDMARMQLLTGRPMRRPTPAVLPAAPQGAVAGQPGEDTPSSANAANDSPADA